MALEDRIVEQALHMSSLRFFAVRTIAFDTREGHRNNSCSEYPGLCRISSSINYFDHLEV